ncbi:Wzz/FepE/Etk N-terminal domain-containing protein [Sediminibacterium sp. KACHI17]
MQQEPIIPSPIQDDPPFSLTHELQRLFLQFKQALLHWKLWTGMMVIGMILGLIYSFIKPVTYQAKTVFVVEESKSVGGGSLMSALAGQFGVDIGNLSGASGILAGDNVLQLLKSEQLIKKTLLSWYDSTNNSTLADEYARLYQLSDKWKKKFPQLQSFAVLRKGASRLEDSLLKKIIERHIQKELSVAKPDKKLGFFEMNVTMRGEVLSVLFSQRLLKTATDFYIETKTKRLLTNVQRLQNKADSLLYMLNRKTYSAADANRLLLDVNPVYSNPEVSAEISSRDKVLQGTIYAEILKNLEISKTSLIQETPTVQLVDEPVYPLKNNAWLWWEGLFFGAILGAALGIGIGVIGLSGNQVIG